MATPGSGSRASFLMEASTHAIVPSPPATTTRSCCRKAAAPASPSAMASCEVMCGERVRVTKEKKRKDYASNEGTAGIQLRKRRGAPRVTKQRGQSSSRLSAASRPAPDGHPGWHLTSRQLKHSYSSCQEVDLKSAPHTRTSHTRRHTHMLMHMCMCIRNADTHTAPTWKLAHIRASTLSGLCTEMSNTWVEGWAVGGHAIGAGGGQRISQRGLRLVRVGVVRWAKSILQPMCP